MSLRALNCKLKNLQRIKGQMLDARERMTTWIPYSGCSNITRAKYHEAFKDLGYLEKELRKEGELLTNWLYQNKFNIFDYTEKYKSKWLILAAFVGFIVGFITKGF